MAMMQRTADAKNIDITGSAEGRTCAPAISLVIATYNRAQLLTAALDSVARSRLEDPGQVEVIVVDNNSTDETPRVVCGLRDNGFRFALHYVREKKQGVSAARNAGIEKARGDYVAFMDDDQRMASDYFVHAIAALQETEAVCIGGPGIYPDTDGLPRWLVPLLERSVKSPSTEAVRRRKMILWRPRDRDYLIGGNMIIRRDSLIRVEGFDEKLGRCGDSLLASEEFELQDRLYDLGLTIAYHPGLIQYHYLHPVRRTRGYWRKRLFYHGRTEYMYKLAPRSARARKLFRAPRWLWWYLLKRDLPAFLGSRLARDAYRRFDGELGLWHRAGEIWEARLENRGRKRHAKLT